MTLSEAGRMIARAAAVAAMSLTAACVARGGLVGHWTFDDPQAPGRDASGRNPAMQMLNGARWTEQGKYGGALSCDGVDDLTRLDAVSLDVSRSMTLAAWVYHHSTGGTHTGGIEKLQSYRLYVDGHDEAASRWSFTFMRPDTVFSGVTSAARVPNDSWHHIAVTHDGATTTMYVDGEFSTSHATNTTIKTNGYQFVIGSGDSTRAVRCMFDDVRVYDEALPLPEIRKLMGGEMAKLARADDGFYLRKGDVVLLLGDALTVDAGFWRLIEDDLAETYPQLARGGGTPALRCENGGAAGHTTADCLRRLPELLARVRPTVAVVCYGLNDMCADPQRYDSQMREILGRLVAARVATTVLTPPGLYISSRPELAPFDEALKGMVAGLRAIARYYGAAFANCHGPMRAHAAAGKDDFTWGDGVHPNALGHRMIAEALREAWRFGQPMGADE